jgi:putative N6-adenine-specific DNA methylase
VAVLPVVADADNGAVGHRHAARSLDLKEEGVDRVVDPEEFEPPARQRATVDGAAVGIGAEPSALDAAGESLSRRGYRPPAAVAPLNEVLAAGLLGLAGWEPGTPLYDPMCGSGTFVIEAAEIASGLNPGRTRQFAFEKLASFDAAAWDAMKAAAPARGPAVTFFGSDRDAGEKQSHDLRSRVVEGGSDHDEDGDSRTDGGGHAGFVVRMGEDSQQVHLQSGRPGFVGPVGGLTFEDRGKQGR